jgi:chlorite dismutase
MGAEKETKDLETQDLNIPPVPLTLEGSSVLHKMFSVRWSDWKALPSAEQKRVTEEAGVVLGEMENQSDGQSALFSVLGHKGDLMVLHFRRTFDELKDAELCLVKLKLTEFLEETTSYLSVVELGLYGLTTQLYTALRKKGIQPGTADWNKEIELQLEQGRKAMAGRLWPKIPARRYLCFYPMDKKRGEEKNWYQVPVKERQRMMQEHGFIGRGYAKQVTQIISGSIGFDDWEWGVDLFADDPLVFKKLIYEMRFDEASAIYALFGSFYLGLQFPAAQLGTLLDGKTPTFGGADKVDRQGG